MVSWKSKKEVKFGLLMVYGCKFEMNSGYNIVIFRNGFEKYWGGKIFLKGLENGIFDFLFYVEGEIM